MTFSAWQQLSPTHAAREVHARINRALPAAQRHAAIASLLPERALAEAFEAAPVTGPLGRVPYFIKDVFDVAELDTYAGSTFLPRVRPRPGRDAEVVRRLRREGAVLVGKTHLHEFAYGITGENPHYGDCEHPRFPGRTSGGSSSGSAVAVASGVVPLAIGTDTGGSIRVPAAFCGLYGLRFNTGDALIADAFPLARSFDSAGAFTNHPADMLAMLETLQRPVAAHRPMIGRYIELPELDPDVAAACAAAAAEFAPPAEREMANALRRTFADALNVYHRTVASEAWSQHAPWADQYRDRYDPAVWQRVASGRHVTSTERERLDVAIAAMNLTWAQVFASYDFVILPATPCGALTKADCTPANRQRLLSLTVPASVAGLPVLTVPVPLPSGLTAGLQFVAYDARGPVFPWVLRQQLAAQIPHL